METECNYYSMIGLFTPTKTGSGFDIREFDFNERGEPCNFRWLKVMETTLQPIDILQMTLERMYEAETSEYHEYAINTGYAMAIKDLAKIIGLDPYTYGIKQNN